MEPFVFLVILLLILFIALFVFCKKTCNLFEGGHRTVELDRKNAAGRDLYLAIDMKHDMPTCDDDRLVLPTVDLLPEPYKDMLKSFHVYEATQIGAGAYGVVFLCKFLREAIKPNARAVMCVKVTTKKNEQIKGNMIYDELYKKINRVPEAQDNQIERAANDYRICAVYGTTHYTVGSKVYHVVFMQNMCGRSLSSINTSALPLDILKIIIFNLICGVYALHEVFHITHFDLKPDNIMYARPVDESEKSTFANLRIIDWGFAMPMGEHKAFRSIGRSGTPLFMPPNHIVSLYGTGGSKRCVIGYKDDIFSLGVIMFILLTGMRGYYRSAATPSRGYLTYEAEEILRHPGRKDAWVSENISRKWFPDGNLSRLVVSALDLDENNRATIKDLINNPCFDDIPLDCVPNFLYEREEYIRRLDLHAEETNAFVLRNRKIDPIRLHVSDTTVPKIELPSLPKEYEEIPRGIPLPETYVQTPLSKSYVYPH